MKGETGPAETGRNGRQGVWIIMVFEQKKEEPALPEKAVTAYLALFHSFSAAFFIGKWVIRAAYLERGYVAYGGEYCLIIAVFFISLWIVSRFFKRKR